MTVYKPEQLGITPTTTGGVWKDLAWYEGRQYVGGTLSEKNQIHPNSPQQGAGQQVSQEVRRQSAAQQGVSVQDFENFLFGNSSGPGSNGLSGSGFSGGDIGSILGAPKAPALQAIYDQALKEYKIDELQKDADKAQSLIDTRRRELAEASNTINENPFLSEGSRTGRIAKLTDFAQDDINNYINELSVKEGKIAQAKADAQLKVNIATGQYNLDQQSYTNNLNTFNSLLSSGALSGASGADIAALGASIGVPTSMIQSAINVQKQKDTPTQVITATADDGTVTAAIINSSTGEVISKQSLGQIGNKQNSGSGGYSDKDMKSAISQFLEEKKNSYGHVHPNDWARALQSYVADGLGAASDFYKTFSNYADHNRGDFSKAYGFSLE